MKEKITLCLRDFSHLYNEATFDIVAIYSFLEWFSTSESLTITVMVLPSIAHLNAVDALAGAGDTSRNLWQTLFITSNLREAKG